MDDAPIQATDSASAEQSTKRSRQSRPNKTHQKPRLVGKVVAGIILILLVLLAGWFVQRSYLISTINSDRYQAVFFVNGQVYFGKLQSLNDGYFKLTDIFYLQTPAQDASKNPQHTANQQTSDVQLIKLGSEVHGPEDEMIINKDQVLFFENLKKNSTVSDSITKYNSQKK